MWKKKRYRREVVEGYRKMKMCKRRYGREVEKEQRKKNQRKKGMEDKWRRDRKRWKMLKGKKKYGI